MSTPISSKRSACFLSTFSLTDSLSNAKDIQIEVRLEEKYVQMGYHETLDAVLASRENLTAIHTFRISQTLLEIRQALPDILEDPLPF